jgi:hypothetical protein
MARMGRRPRGTAPHITWVLLCTLVTQIFEAAGCFGSTQSVWPSSEHSKVSWGRSMAVLHPLWFTPYNTPMALHCMPLDELPSKWLAVLAQAKSDILLLGIQRWAEAEAWQSIVTHRSFGFFIGAWKECDFTLMAIPAPANMSHFALLLRYPAIEGGFGSSQTVGHSSSKHLKVSWGGSMAIHCEPQLLHHC